VSDVAARDAVFVIDTGLNTLWSGNWIRQNGQQRIIGSFNNGAVGAALGQANGIQALDRHRALRRRRFQHADVRIPYRRAS
jgi:pyruvate dehydrogenase (quinone)